METCMCITWSTVCAVMDGWLSCHDSCSLSRCTFVIDSNHFVRESSTYAGSKPYIVIVTLSVLLFPVIYYHLSWLTRDHTYRFDNFSQWVDKIGVYLGILCSGGAALPSLKYVGGAVLSMDYWQEPFHLLELPRAATMERLTFGEVLGASDLIVRKAQDLKVRRRYPFSPLGP